MIFGRDLADVCDFLLAVLQGGDAHAGGARVIKWLMDGSSARTKGRGESAVSQIIQWLISVQRAYAGRNVWLYSACTARCRFLKCDVGVYSAVAYTL